MKSEIGNAHWNLQDAKARLSELVDLAASGHPQVILRRGEPTAAVVSIEDYERLRTGSGSLVSFLLHETPKFEGFEIERSAEVFEPRVDFSGPEFDRDSK